MSRRHSAEHFIVPRKPDRFFQSTMVRHLSNMLMLHGEYAKAYAIVTQALTMATQKHFGQEFSGGALKEKVNEFMDLVIDAAGPDFEVKSKRVGGATYPVPVPVKPSRRQTLGFRYLVTFARKRKEQNTGKRLNGRAVYAMSVRLMSEMLDLLAGRGGTFNKKLDMHRMAQANLAYAGINKRRKKEEEN